jgi:predicted aspartyl protease
VLGAGAIIVVAAAGCGGLHRREHDPDAGGEPSSGVVVPAVVAGPAMFVTLKLEGHPYVFRIDTGALTTTVDTSVAKALALRDRGTPSMASTVGCPTRVQPVAISDWTLGKATLPARTIQSAHTVLAELKLRGVEIGGLLGDDVLSRFGTVTLDFAHKRLILGGAVEPGPDTIPLQLDRYRRQLFITAQATIGGDTGRYVIDTGSPTLAMQSRTAAKLGLKPAGQSAEIAGVSGCTVNVTPIRITNWAMGGKKMPAIAGITSRSPFLPATVERRGILGIIGANALAPFGQISIDFSKQRMQLGKPPG